MLTKYPLFYLQTSNRSYVNDDEDMNVLWAIIWFLVLWFLAWPVGFFCAGWYVCLSPIEACLDAIKAVTELLMKGVMLPLEVAKHMVEGKAGWWKKFDELSETKTSVIDREFTFDQGTESVFSNLL